MATFNEIFQNYVDYGFTRPTTPVSTVQGIETLAPTMTQQVQSISPIGGDNTNTTGPTSTGTGNISKEGIMQALGFMMNPALGITNMAVQNITGKSIAQQISEAVNSMMGRSIGPTPGAEDNGGAGGGNPAASSDPDSQGDTGAATGGDGGGVGSSSDAGAGSTGSCGSFKDGGYVALGINSRDFK